MLNSSPDVGPSLQPLMSSPIVRAAADLNLGIAYQRQDYFANGLVHTRNIVVILAEVDGQWVELNIPFKDGDVTRINSQTSPLHRRFAWMWWFLALECGDICGSASSPVWFLNFLDKLCEKDAVAWAAVDHGLRHDQLSRVRQVVSRVYSYRFAKPGMGVWWNRDMMANSTWPGLHIDKICF